MAKIDKAIYEIVGHKLRDEREKLGYSLEFVADKVGLTKKTIQRYETAESRITTETLYSLCSVLKIDPKDLISHFIFDFSNDNSEVEHVTSEFFRGRQSIPHYPLYSHISCGTASFIEDNIEEYITLPNAFLNPKKQYFCQYAKGDSMIGENILPGDLLVFEKTDIIEDGKIGCFCVDHNEATCKKFYQDKATGIITLQPANDAYMPIIVTPEALHFKVIGKLTLVINKR